GNDLGIAGPDDLDVDLAVHPDRRPATGADYTHTEAEGIKTAERTAGTLPLSVNRDVMAARLSRYIEPRYPPDASAAQIKGLVEVSVRVSPKGDVTDVKLLSGHPALARAAIAAVKQWPYKPFVVQGRPVAVTPIVDVSFPPKRADQCRSCKEFHLGDSITR